jgi:hypothetical protein
MEITMPATKAMETNIGLPYCAPSKPAKMPSKRSTAAANVSTSRDSETCGNNCRCDKLITVWLMACRSDAIASACFSSLSDTGRTFTAADAEACDVTDAIVCCELHIVTIFLRILHMQDDEFMHPTHLVSNVRFVEVFVPFKTETLPLEESLLTADVTLTCAGGVHGRAVDGARCSTSSISTADISAALCQTTHSFMKSCVSSRSMRSMSSRNLATKRGITCSPCSHDEIAASLLVSTGRRRPESSEHD